MSFLRLICPRARARVRTDVWTARQRAGPTAGELYGNKFLVGLYSHDTHWTGEPVHGRSRF